MEAVTYTELELIVLRSLEQADEFDEKPCDCIANLRDNTGLTTKVLRGVLSSLVLKEAVSTGEYPNGLTCFYYEL